MDSSSPSRASDAGRRAESASTDERGYWYPAPDETSPSPTALLEELRRYQESGVRMRARIRSDMDMGEKDLLALRHLLSASSAGRVLRQRDLAERLDLRGASVSALVDRLVRDGYATRTPHPEDRRSIAVVPTARGDQEVRRTLHDVHDRMYEVAAALSPADRSVITDFLRRMNHDVDRP
ncbi:MarR family winged helix-turn-helix transcriptional regulator [Brachybacterium endophyticum]|uniref:MarR family winged helix-turn-helix transcriptional regulator n=1 Tax=Brachybacterium endophyticum TaxID=2182385 RepID=UPI001F0B76CF|nr:MarR family transcriptional regulator [Brachybacterium endophyticum]